MENEAAEELKGYHTEHEYYPDYIHADIHGVTDAYTNPRSCLAWDAAMDAIIWSNLYLIFILGRLSPRQPLHQNWTKWDSLVLKIRNTPRLTKKKAVP
ncbi:MAG: hypothetical protein KME38_23450 [Spirirestis rafaelensis WJT71-NPBG6]|jgi:hypothetical protein|nr:hypothetical protein [Spirirestis rafaelensis WJT71-NPBG6]